MQCPRRCNHSRSYFSFLLSRACRSAMRVAPIGRRFLVNQTVGSSKEPIWPCLVLVCWFCTLLNVDMHTPASVCAIGSSLPCIRRPRLSPRLITLLFSTPRALSAGDDPAQLTSWHSALGVYRHASIDPIESFTLAVSGSGRAPREALRLLLPWSSLPKGPTRCHGPTESVDRAHVRLGARIALWCLPARCHVVSRLAFLHS